MTDESSVSFLGETPWAGVWDEGETGAHPPACPLPFASDDVRAPHPAPAHDHGHTDPRFTPSTCSCSRARRSQIRTQQLLLPTGTHISHSHPAPACAHGHAHLRFVPGGCSHYGHADPRFKRRTGRWFITVTKLYFGAQNPCGSQL